MSVNTAILDLFLARGHLRAEISTRGFSRISDVLNNAPGDFLTGTLIQIGGTEAGLDGLRSVQPRELVVRLNDVLLVQPVEERAPTQGSATDERRSRLAQRMVIELGEWEVRGALHLVDPIPWVDFVTFSANRFVPVTRGSIRAPGAHQPTDSPFLLVNGSRISALYEERPDD